jgi:hypothetical protein
LTIAFREARLACQIVSLQIGSVQIPVTFLALKGLIFDTKFSTPNHFVTFASVFANTFELKEALLYISQFQAIMIQSVFVQKINAMMNAKKGFRFHQHVANFSKSYASFTLDKICLKSQNKLAFSSTVHKTIFMTITLGLWK